MPDRVHAELPQHQRPLLGQVLETREVGAQVGSAVEVNVVGKKVRLLGKKVFRRRKIRVRRQRRRILILDDARQGIQERLDPLRAVPADKVRRNLVVDIVAEDGRMTGLAFGRAPAAATAPSP
ncbi:MAG: hypothetical protein EBT68_01395 [Verrucomicrobia bacterium]|nr:hypothetical protein [Verrucomicrobiota bacterium]